MRLQIPFIFRLKIYRIKSIRKYRNFNARTHQIFHGCCLSITQTKCEGTPEVTSLYSRLDLNLTESYDVFCTSRNCLLLADGRLQFDILGAGLSSHSRKCHQNIQLVNCFCLCDCCFVCSVSWILHSFDEKSYTIESLNSIIESVIKSAIVVPNS